MAVSCLRPGALGLHHWRARQTTVNSLFCEMTLHCSQSTAFLTGQVRRAARSRASITANAGEDVCRHMDSCERCMFGVSAGRGALTQRSAARRIMPRSRRCHSLTSVCIVNGADVDVTASRRTLACCWTGCDLRVAAPSAWGAQRCLQK
jgi:hypothetical protein